jgi:uncharacterized RDD family membrane protein YckC
MSSPHPIRRIAEAVVPRAVEMIPLDEVLAEIDLDLLLSRIDLNALLARVDLNELMNNIDIDALVARIDVDQVIDRVDIQHLVERLNIEDIVRRAQVEAIFRATAGGLTNRLLDLIRRQLVGLDIIMTRIVDRTLHRHVGIPMSEEGSFTGQVAGGATRLAAFFLDLGIVSVAYAAIIASGFFLASLFVGHNIQPSNGTGLWRILGIIALAIVYQWLSLVIAGRTIGRAIAGLRVTAPDGSALTPFGATRRVLVYPFSFVLALGLIGIVLRRDHRAWHDRAAPSIVRYDWRDRPAMMPGPLTSYLERSGVMVRPEVEADRPASTVATDGQGGAAGGPSQPSPATTAPGRVEAGESAERAR